MSLVRAPLQKRSKSTTSRLAVRFRMAEDRAARRLATGRVALIVIGLMLVAALAALDARRPAARRAELEEFILEPIGTASLRQMALAESYRNSMLWYLPCCPGPLDLSPLILLSGDSWRPVFSVCSCFFESKEMTMAPHNGP